MNMSMLLFSLMFYAGKVGEVPVRVRLKVEPVQGAYLIASKLVPYGRDALLKSDRWLASRPLKPSSNDLECRFDN